MKTIAISEARAKYNVDPAALDEPTVIEVGGKPVAVLVPYEQWEKLQARQGKQDELPQVKAPKWFLREEEAFYRLLPQLLEQYRGSYVGIYKGKVVAVGDSAIAVMEDVQERLGPRIHPYVGWVETEPRVVRMPFVRVPKR
jgi:prevent-host-death family protein